ncbi:MAG: CPBP family intramembrane metalloprotease [Actinomycetota bacterium]|nr:CPBP family intramembrane metalloprotease [Actinomycetota bacterium]
MTLGAEQAQPPAPDAGLRAPRRIAWSGAQAVAVALSTLLVGLAISALTRWLGLDTEWYSGQTAAVQSAFRLATMGLPYAVTLGLVVVLVRSSGEGWRDGLGLRGFPVLPGVALAVLLAFFARVGTTAWTTLLLRLGQVPPDSLDVMGRFPQGPLGIATLIAVAAVIAPVAEEIAYRGVLYPALRNRWGVTAAVALSSAVFALLHFNVVWLGLPIWILGMLLARLFERTGSLWPPIVAHALFNLSAVALWFAGRALGGV